MSDSIEKIAHQLMLQCPLAGKPLATMWCQNSFARLADLYDRWSWRTNYGEFRIPDAYSTGTVSIASTDPTLLTGSGTTWTPLMVGRQFIAGSSGLLDIVQFIDSTHMRLGLPWGDADLVNAGYMIRRQYVTVPDDFQAFISVIDPTRNQRLRTGVEKRQIDTRDSRRVTTGTATVIAEAGSARRLAGSVDMTPIAAKGTGPLPVLTGTYTGPADALFTIEVTTGGASGTAVFKYKRETGAYITGLVSDSAGVGLSDGITVYWPAAIYVLGDIFVARARANSVLSKPRFEIWPGQMNQIVFPYYYATAIPDLTLPGSVLPNGIRGDVILKGAMSECRAWNGRDSENPNPLYDLKGSAKDLAEFEQMVNILCLRDDDIYPKDVTYYQDLEFAGPLWDASYERSHA